MTIQDTSPRIWSSLSYYLLSLRNIWSGFQKISVIPIQDQAEMFMLCLPWARKKCYVSQSGRWRSSSGWPELSQSVPQGKCFVRMMDGRRWHVGWGVGSQVVTFLSIQAWLLSMENQVLISPQSDEGGLSWNTRERHTWTLLSRTRASQCSTIMQSKLWIRQG